MSWSEESENSFLFTLDSKPRFKVDVFTHRSTKSPKTAALIIPRGRECDYMFSHEQGRAELCTQQSLDRMLFICLCRQSFSQSYHSPSSQSQLLSQLQSELSGVLKSLLELVNSKSAAALPTSRRAAKRTAPSSASNSSDSAAVPIMALSDQIMSNSVELCTIPLDDNDSLVVEDADVDSDRVRRLVFFSSGLAQSEMRLQDQKLQFNFLCCEYQRAMLLSLSLTNPNSHESILIIGTGAGCMPSYLHEWKSMPFSITTVDSSKPVLDAAKQYFDLSESSVTLF